MAKKTPENVELAKLMFARGETLDQIKDYFGVKSKSTICYWVNSRAYEKRLENSTKYSKQTNHKAKRIWDKRNQPKKNAYKKAPEQRARDRVRTNKRYRTDLLFRLKALLRDRLNKALKHNFKSGSAVRDLGCSVEFLKQHLESQFQEDMTWKNYGQWHIDHKKPLASFDLTDRKQFLKACHYTNLQPLWAADNIRKGVKCSAENLCSG